MTPKDQKMYGRSYSQYCEPKTLQGAKAGTAISTSAAEEPLMRRQPWPTWNVPYECTVTYLD